MVYGICSLFFQVHIKKVLWWFFFPSMLIYWNHAAQEIRLTFHQLQRTHTERERDRRYLGTTWKDTEHEKKKHKKNHVPLHLPPNVSKAKSAIWAAKVKIRVTDSSFLLAFESTICPLSSVQTHSWWRFWGGWHCKGDTVKSDSCKWLVRWKSVRVKVIWDEKIKMISIIILQRS